MKRILITGITGMIGAALSEYLASLDYEVAGISRSSYPKAINYYKHYRGDIMDSGFLNRVWSDFKPDVVYHLAGQAYNSMSWERENTTYLHNIQGTHNVLEAHRTHSPNARFIPACSSAQYGIVQAQPIKETEQLNPITPYGVSKVAVENMTRQYHYNYGIDVVIPRLFIHIGPNHPPFTAVQNICMQFAAIKLGKQANRITCGNITTCRDFVDVRDGVIGLHVLQERGVNGESYNICSGKSESVYGVIEYLKEITNIGNPVIIKDKYFVRPSDEQALTGDPTKINKLGWHTTTTLYDTIRDIHYDWIKRIQNGFDYNPNI